MFYKKVLENFHFYNHFRGTISFLRDIVALKYISSISIQSETITHVFNLSEVRCTKWKSGNIIESGEIKRLHAASNVYFYILCLEK